MAFRFFVASLALLVACSDFDCPGGEARVDGMCTSVAVHDPEPIAKPIPLACANNLTPPLPGAAGYTMIEWELTVDPRPILSDTLFATDLKVFAGFNEFFLNGAQFYLAGRMRRFNLQELRATVVVRRGVVGAQPLLLEFDRAKIPWTCRYDARGNAEFGGRDFPSCSPENTNLDDSNDDCTGLGGAPDPSNQCGQFISTQISEDCSEGGTCDSLGKRWDIWPSAFDLCKANGFCVTAPLEVELERDDESLLAAEAGSVLFGLDDVNTGWELDQSNGPNHGTWEVERPVFTDPPGPNSVRVIAGDVEVALECTMAMYGKSVFAEESRDRNPAPAPDHLLVSFPIQEP